MDPSHIGPQIRRIREGYGFSVQALAELARMPSERVADIEEGKHPTSWELATLGDALATDPAALWRGDAGQNPRRSTARFRAPGGVKELGPRDARLLARAATVGKIVAHLRAKLGDPPSPVVQARNVVAVDPYLAPWDHGYRLGKKARDLLSPAKTPIVSLQGLLEQLGVHIAWVDFETTDIVAASLYEPEAAPVILLNRRSTSRVQPPLSRRAVLAHELCHLLHDGGASDLLTMISRVEEHVSYAFEQRANGFAPSFIVPGGWLELEVEEPRAYVLAVAKRWGLSFEGAAWHTKNAARLTEADAQALVKDPNKVPVGDFEPTLLRRDPTSLDLDVETSPLANGLLAEVTMRALEAELITAGRAIEILTIR